MFLTRLSVKHPVFAAMMMLALLVLGLFSLKTLPIEQFPDVKFPFAIVVTRYPGASPEVVESEVSRPMEESLNTINGVKTLRSFSSEGQSLILVEFSLSTDILDVMPDVREKVAQVKAGFRDEIQEPVISRWNPDELPVTAVAISAPQRSMRELTELADKVISKRLQAISGIGSARIIGGERREVQIRPDPERLRAYGLGVDQVLSALKQENQDLPAGSVSQGNRDTVVQIRGKLQSVDDFRRLVVGSRNAAPIYLEQVAEVLDTAAEAENRSLVDGQPALAIELLKVQGANAIALVDNVKLTVEALRRELPPDIQLSLVGDTSRGIRNSLHDVKNTLLEGAALTIAIVFLFLGSWRSTVITGLTLPIALIGTVWALKLFGFSINTMTLMAMSLSVGLLIDDAIVVRENIVRHMAMGKSPMQAALDGTQEIGLAVMATTFTIVAVFLPVGFMGGIIGKFFFQFGIAVSAAVLISLFVAFTLDPMLSSIWPDPHEQRERSFFGRLYQRFETGLTALTAVYARTMAWALDYRKTVLAIAVSSLIAAFVLARFLGSEFVPEADLSEINVQIETAQGSSLDYTAAKARQVSQTLQAYPEVTSVYASVGKTNVYLKALLKEKKDRVRGQNALIIAMRNALNQIAGIQVRSVQPASKPNGDDKTIQISLRGPDLKTLSQLADQLVGKLQTVPGLVDVETSLRSGKPSLSVVVDREKASGMGLSVGQIAETLRPLIAGEQVSVWQAPDGQSYPVMVRLPHTRRENAGDLQNLPLSSQQIDPATAAPRLFTLNQVAHLQQDTGASKITRKNLFREVLISANVAGRPAGVVGQDIEQIKNRMQLPAGYRFETEGSNKDMEESVGFAAAALLMAVIFIYLILASQFNSLLHPLAIMTSLPLSLIGVLLALFLWGSTLNIFSIIGIIMLMGVVTKNAILLVDFVEQATAHGMDQRSAIIESGRVRLRPILMTTAAMVMGMLPLALGLGEGGEQRAPMAQAVIGGVITSTLLTLIVVPVVYTYFEQFQQWFLRLMKIQPGKNHNMGR